MKNKLEEQMTEVMDGASVKDLLPDFDTAALWNEVAAQLPQPEGKKQALALGWVARIAAVLLVVFAAWAAIHFAGSSRQDAVVVVHASPAKATEQVPTIPVPAARAGLPSKAAIIKEAPHYTVAKETPHQEHMAQEPSVPQVTNEAARPGPAIAVPQQIATTASPKKVTHYLDIDDGTPADNPAQAVAATPFIRVKLNKPGISDNASQQKPLKEWVLALSK